MEEKEELGMNGARSEDAGGVELAVGNA